MNYKEAWVKALDHCRRVGKNEVNKKYFKCYKILRIQGNLASIPDYETNQFVAGLSKNRMWIGAQRDPMDKSKFIWSDGSPMSSQFWSIREPNSLAEECAEINLHTHGTWNDLRCHYKKNYVCQSRGD